MSKLRTKEDFTANIGKTVFKGYDAECNCTQCVNKIESLFIPNQEQVDHLMHVRPLLEAFFKAVGEGPIELNYYTSKKEAKEADQRFYSSRVSNLEYRRQLHKFHFALDGQTVTEEQIDARYKKIRITPCSDCVLPCTECIHDCDAYGGDQVNDQ